MPLRYDISGYVLADTGSRGVCILGGLPLIPSRPIVYDHFFEALSKDFPEFGMFTMKSLSVKHPFWEYIHHSRTLRELFDIYLPDGIRQCHSISLPATVEEYLGRFKTKKRYNLKRQERLLRAHGGGQLELRRVEYPDQIDAFVDNARSLGGTVGPLKRRRMTSFYDPVFDNYDLTRLQRKDYYFPTS